MPLLPAQGKQPISWSYVVTGDKRRRARLEVSLAGELVRALVGVLAAQGDGEAVQPSGP
jgi:hypothetical protein